MKNMKLIAAVAALVGLSACASTYDRTQSESTSYVAPRASMDTTASALPGAGAAGGGGAGAVSR